MTIYRVEMSYTVDEEEGIIDYINTNFHTTEKKAIKEAIDTVIHDCGLMGEFTERFRRDLYGKHADLTIGSTPLLECSFLQYLRTELENKCLCSYDVVED